MKKILVIGATGLVGSRFVSLVKDKVGIIPVDENTLDITSFEAVDKYFSEKYFDSVLNFAAITNVDAAEKEKGNESGITWKLNVDGVENLNKASIKYNKFIVQISTDFVFKGDQENPGPYNEVVEIPNSIDGIGWYGWTKNRAENLLRKSESRNAIARIAYPFYAAEFGSKLDYAKNYLKLYDERKLFPVFTDQTLSVLNVDDLAEPLLKILTEELTGIFHIVSSNTTTPFDFVAYLLKKSRNIEGVVKKGLMEEFLKVEGRTPRPRLGGFKTEITENRLNIKFKTWQEMVDEFVKQLN